MKIELICLGSELLKDKVNTNSILIAQRLASIGLSISRVTTVGDDAIEIENALKDAIKRSNIVFTSGGLGPTFDDLTRECTASVLKQPLHFSKKLFDVIKTKFKSLNIPMPQENIKQSYVIGNAKILVNKVGTAPGQLLKIKNRLIVLLPGPPKELIPMMDDSVCLYLKKHYAKSISKNAVFHIFGYPESTIDERIKPVTEKIWSSKNVKVIFGILAHKSIIDVKVTVHGENDSLLKKTLFKIQKEICGILGNDIYGKNEETLESVVGKMLKSRKETLSIAESCSGGSISDKITNVPGCSAYFKEGIVAYSNESKVRLLAVPKKILQKFGAVSQQTAEEMAKGVLRRADSDWGVAVTGIAGPAGGTKEKPVGLVWFALAAKKELSRESKKIYSIKKKFWGTRQEIKERTALTALDLLRRAMLLIS